MTGFDTSRLSPEVAAYIRSLETRVEKIEALEKQRLQHCGKRTSSRRTSC